MGKALTKTLMVRKLGKGKHRPNANDMTMFAFDDAILLWCVRT